MEPPVVVTETTPPEPALDGLPPKENRPKLPPPEPGKPPTLCANMPTASEPWVTIALELVTWTKPPAEAAAPLPPTLIKLPPAPPPAPPAAPTLCAQMPAAPVPKVERSSTFDTVTEDGAPPSLPLPPCA